MKARNFIQIVQRWDTIALPAQSFERTPQGGIRAPARFTRVGVLPYELPDGTKRREWRPPEEVFAPESMSTLEDVPITVHHPKSGEVHADSYQAESVGHVRAGVAPEDGKYIGGKAVLQDESTVRGALNGSLGELSAGYTSRLDMTPGIVPEGQPDAGQPYDCIQRNIRYNHVAILPPGLGRAGKEVALRLDSLGNQLQGEPTLRDRAIAAGWTEQDFQGVAELGRLAERATLSTQRIDGKLDAFEKLSDDEIQQLLDVAELPMLKRELIELLSEEATRDRDHDGLDEFGDEREPIRTTKKGDPNMLCTPEQITTLKALATMVPSIKALLASPRAMATKTDALDNSELFDDRTHRQVSDAWRQPSQRTDSSTNIAEQASDGELLDDRLHRQSGDAWKTRA